MMTALEKLGKQISVKIADCNEEQLQNIRDFGCRMLILANGVGDENNNGNLRVQDTSGRLKRMTPTEL